MHGNHKTETVKWIERKWVCGLSNVHFYFHFWIEQQKRKSITEKKKKRLMIMNENKLWSWIKVDHIIITSMRVMMENQKKKKTWSLKGLCTTTVISKLGSSVAVNVDDTMVKW